MSDVCGYTNFETATVGFYVAHNRGPNEYWKQVARDYLAEGQTVTELAQSLEQFYTLDAVPVKGLVGELLDGALNAVDWLDVAETIMSSVKEEMAYQEVG